MKSEISSDNITTTTKEKQLVSFEATEEEKDPNSMLFKSNTEIGDKSEKKAKSKLSSTIFGPIITSNFIKVICITLAIIIIPLEIFVQHALQYAEGQMIISI